MKRETGWGVRAAWLVAAALLAGCAGGLDKSADSVDLSRDSLVVMSMRFHNAFKPGTETRSLGVVYRARGSATPPAPGGPSNGIPPGQNTRQTMVFERTEPGANDVLLVLPVAPGAYEVSRLVGQLRTGPWFADVNFAVQAPFDVKPRSVAYLGRLDLTNVGKGAGDQASGLAIPVIPQAAAGLVDGTLEVRLVDAFDEDVARLRSNYKALRDLSMDRTPLPRMSIEPATGSGASAKQAVVVR